MKQLFFFSIESDGTPIIDVKFENFQEFYDYIESLDFSKFFGLESVVYSIDMRPAYGHNDIYFEACTYCDFCNKWHRFERDTY